MSYEKAVVPSRTARMQSRRPAGEKRQSGDALTAPTELQPPAPKASLSTKLQPRRHATSKIRESNEDLAKCLRGQMLISAGRETVSREGSALDLSAI